MITTYNLMLDKTDNNHPQLAKEASFDYENDSFTTPEQIVDMLNACFQMDACAEEYTYLLVMDSAGHPLGVFNLSHGSVCECLVGTREIFIRILLSGGSCFAIAHNHPSGQTRPSTEDRQICRKIKEAASLLNIKMLDFIIVGSDSFLSFSREGLL